VGRFSLGVIVVGVAVLAGFTAMLIALLIIVLSGHTYIFLGSCTVSRHPVCSPVNPWSWTIPAAGVLGAAAGAIGTSLIWQNRVRPPTPTIFD
jgi:hypothetical protein